MKKTSWKLKFIFPHALSLFKNFYSSELKNILLFCFHNYVRSIHFAAYSKKLFFAKFFKIDKNYNILCIIKFYRSFVQITRH